MQYDGTKQRSSRTGKRAGRGRLPILLCLIFCPALALAETINVAVAANFTPTMRLIKEAFESGSSHTVSLISGSSGKHFAQISNGAPYHIFLSADEERVELLKLQDSKGTISSKIYAVGRLALWSRNADMGLDSSYLKDPSNYNHLALANPDLAPYGRAAMEVLQSLGLADELGPRLVYGENVGQVFQYAYSGNADLGFVAYSQVLSSNVSGSYWVFPESFYSPVRQSAALLSDSAGSLSLYEFLSSERASQIIQHNGYVLPESGE